MRVQKHTDSWCARGIIDKAADRIMVLAAVLSIRSEYILIRKKYRFLIARENLHKAQVQV